MEATLGLTSVGSGLGPGRFEEGYGSTIEKACNHATRIGRQYISKRDGDTALGGCSERARERACYSRTLLAAMQGRGIGYGDAEIEKLGFQVQTSTERARKGDTRQAEGRGNQ